MILRNFAMVSTLGIVTLAVAHAGTIQTELGGVNGLTASAVTLAGTTTPTEVNYDTTVFSGAMNGSTAPTPYTGYGTGSGGTDKDSAADGGAGVTFAMINDSNVNANAWFMPSAGTVSSSVTIPVGIFGVTDVWTLADIMQGASNGRDLTVVLTFGTNATGSAGLETVTLRPNDTTTANGSGTAQNAVDCVASTHCTGTTAGSTDGSVGTPMSPYTMPQGSAAGDGSGTPTALTGTVANVYADNLFTFGYTSASGVYAGTTGNVTLNDEGFVFAGSLATIAAGDYLQSITVKANGTSAGSGVFLQAITVDSSSAPEPSTVLMLLSGLGAIGISRFRRK